MTSRTLTAQEISTSTASTTPLIGKELILRGRRDWQQGIKSTGIIKGFYKEKEN
jgi:hypothetical protein